MQVELLYFDGCPNHESLLPHLRELLSSAGAATDIELVRVEDLEVAERERFLGSPTLRIDGVDVEPGAEQRSDFGLKCRLFSTPDGLRGMPADEWVLAAMQRTHPHGKAVTVRDGKVTEMVVYPTVEDAPAAGGVDERP